MLITALLSPSYSFAQNASCGCPPNKFQTSTKADTVYHLLSGHSIALCGYGDAHSPDSIFSEFVLAACGNDTVIDFWGAELNCRLRVNRDTLLVNQLVYLATGHNYQMEEWPWWIDKIYYSKNRCVKEGRINRNIHLYSSEQIREVLGAYLSAGKVLNDSTMVLVERLYIAAISGSQQTRSYLVNFRNRYPLDGAYAEEHDDLMAMLALWDDKRF